MNTPSLKFSGVYIQNVQGRVGQYAGTRVDTHLELLLKNDEQGDHLDHFRSITGMYSNGFGHNEHSITLKEVDADGHSGDVFRVLAGGIKQINLKNAENFQKVEALLNEVKNLHPRIKAALTSSLETQKHLEESRK